MSDKPWAGRFTQAADAAAERFTASLAFDRRLWPYDVAGSIAWARALGRAGLLSGEERDAIVKGLEALTAECAAAAREAGVFDEVMASLDASEKDVSWAERVTGGSVAELAVMVSVSLAPFAAPAGTLTVTAIVWLWPGASGPTVAGSDAAHSPPLRLSP